MFLVPLGNDVSIRRMPWLTIAVMALCVLVQIDRSASEPDGQERIGLLRDRQSVQVSLLRRFGNVESEPVARALESGVAVDGVVDSLDVPPGDPDLSRLHELDLRIARLASADLADRFGFRPSHLLSPSLLLHAFIHGGWLHLVGNLLFLWLVGCNLEDRWGRAAFASVYLAGAAASALAFALWHPGSDSPLVGASGAVAAGMGAFAVCHHDANIRFGYLFIGAGLHPRFGTFGTRALFALPLWFAVQLASAAWFETGMGGVAHSAHVGGFLFGVGVALAFKWSGIEKRYLLPAASRGVEWEEDPEFVAALSRIAERQFDEASALLEGVVARRPSHGEAWLELSRAALSTGNHATLRRALPRAMSHLARGGRGPEIIALYRRLEDARLDGDLPERSLAELAQAATDGDDADLAARAVTQLESRFPKSALLPRRLWDLASMHSRDGRVVHARSALARLVAAFPFDAFAERARARLAEPFTPPSVPEKSLARRATPAPRVSQPEWRPKKSANEGKTLEIQPGQSKLELDV